MGRITKPHGLRGEVIVDLVTDRVEQRLVPGAVLDTDQGPLTVAAVRPHHDKFIVAFEGASDRAAADRLRGLTLRAAPLDDPEALWVHDLIGAVAVLSGGEEVGRVVAVHANPADDLLELEAGALVPVRFVVGWEGDERATRRLVIDPPEGLLDL